MTTLASAATAGGRPAVEVAHLRTTHGPLVAVDDVSFSVAEGEIFGILGPNGAGKTTAIESAMGLREPDADTIRLLGLDTRAAAAWVPTVSLRVVELTSRRLGNYQYNPVWGFLADQSWVR
jgi:ABC-type Na+ transport system ATPase subunit NatA